MKTKSLISLLFIACCASAHASSEEAALKEFDTSYDKQTLKRGAEVYMNVCQLCHNLKFIKFANLKEVGFSQKEIDEIRGDRHVTDTFTSHMAPKYETNVFGLVPPDLSLMAKARKGGPSYIYTLLTSYYEKKDNVYDNHLFPNIKMPDILSYSVYTQSPDKERIEQEAKDVSNFLNWAADPHAQTRHRMGYFVIAYLLVLTFLLWLVMKRVWSRLDKES